MKGNNKKPRPRATAGVFCHFRKGKYIKERDIVSFNNLALCYSQTVPEQKING